MTTVEYTFFGALIVVLLSVIGFFLTREYSHRDKEKEQWTQALKEQRAEFTHAIEGLSSVVHELNITIADLKDWTWTQFASLREFQVLERRMEDCRDSCPLNKKAS